MTVTARVVSVHAGSNDDMSKQACDAIEVALDGIVGDRHRGYVRKCWPGDKQARGTERRNERQWSAVSVEELAEISTALNLAEALTADRLGANLCLDGVAQLSRLPRGTILRFPSGAELIVEEYNPPCQDMGRQVALNCRTRTGRPLGPTDFPKAAKMLRGLVGVVEAPGVIRAGDKVTIDVFESPAWLARTAE